MQNVDSEWSKKHLTLKQHILNAVNSNDSYIAQQGRELLQYYTIEYEPRNFLVGLEYISYRINGRLVGFYNYAYCKLNELGFDLPIDVD